MPLVPGIQRLGPRRRDRPGRSSRRRRPDDLSGSRPWRVIRWFRSCYNIYPAPAEAHTLTTCPRCGVYAVAQTHLEDYNRRRRGRPGRVHPRTHRRGHQRRPPAMTPEQVQSAPHAAHPAREQRVLDRQAARCEPVDDLQVRPGADQTADAPDRGRSAASGSRDHRGIAAGSAGE